MEEMQQRRGRFHLHGENVLQTRGKGVQLSPRTCHKNEIICTLDLSASEELLNQPKQIGKDNKLAKKVSNNYADKQLYRLVCIQYKINFYV